MSKEKIIKILNEFFEESDLAVKKDLFSLYVNLIEKWNPHINLISKKDMGDIWGRHVLDSVQIFPLFRELEGANFVLTDIGSGGGLPGIILAILCPYHVQLVESDERKCAFLNEVRRKLKLENLEIFNCRIEDVSSQNGFMKANILTSRALGKLNLLFDFSQNLLLEGGICVFPKGKNYKQELNEGKRNYVFNYEVMPSITDDQAVLLKIWNLNRKS